MFKRLFGQPSSSSSSNRNNNNNSNVGSTSSGRAAFDAVDKLKDVRFCFPLVSRSRSPSCPSFDELDETFTTRVSFLSLSLFLFRTRERRLGFLSLRRASLGLSLSLGDYDDDVDDRACRS